MTREVLVLVCFAASALCLALAIVWAWRQATAADAELERRRHREREQDIPWPIEHYKRYLRGKAKGGNVPPSTNGAGYAMQNWTEQETERCAECFRVVDIAYLHQCVRCERTDLCGKCQADHECVTPDERRIMAQEDGQ